MSVELGIIGAGNMAEAIARGVIASKVFSPDQIIAADVSPDRRAIFTTQLQIRAVESSLDAARDAKIVLLSVKPQQMKEVLGQLGAALRLDALVISIAAGISSKFIESHLGARSNWRVIRTMPNTPMLVGEGMVALSAGAHASAADLATARRIFESSAAVIEVTEDQIDAVTAVSGSGPAYFFFLVEQMIRAGVEMGLTPEHARTLAARTALGSAKMLLTSSESPQELRRKVTSPGGTTHAAISHMETNGWPDITTSALHAACARSKELGSA